MSIFKLATVFAKGSDDLLKTKAEIFGDNAAATVYKALKNTGKVVSLVNPVLGSAIKGAAKTAKAAKYVQKGTKMAKEVVDSKATNEVKFQKFARKCFDLTHFIDVRRTPKRRPVLSKVLRKGSADGARYLEIAIGKSKTINARLNCKDNDLNTESGACCYKYHGQIAVAPSKPGSRNTMASQLIDKIPGVIWAKGEIIATRVGAVITVEATVPLLILKGPLKRKSERLAVSTDQWYTSDDSDFLLRAPALCQRLYLKGADPAIGPKAPLTLHLSQYPVNLDGAQILDDQEHSPAEEHVGEESQAQ